MPDNLNMTKNIGSYHLAVQQLKQSSLFHSALEGPSLTVEGYEQGMHVRVMPVFHRNIRNTRVRLENLQKRLDL